MPARITIENGEVLKNSLITTKSNKELSRLTVKTFNYIGKKSDGSPKFEEVFLNGVVFGPTDEVKQLGNGDKINIGVPPTESENLMREMATLRIDENPSMVQVRDEDRTGKAFPSRFPEFTAFANQISVIEKADTTRRSSASSPVDSPYPETDHDDDDFPY